MGTRIYLFIYIRQCPVHIYWFETSFWYSTKYDICSPQEVM